MIHRTAATVAILALIGLTACKGPEGTGTADDATDSGGRITVWVDPPRLPAVSAFQQAGRAVVRQAAHGRLGLPAARHLGGVRGALTRGQMLGVTR